MPMISLAVVGILMRFMHEGVWRGVHHCLSMVTIGLLLAIIDLVGDNREFEV